MAKAGRPKAEVKKDKIISFRMKQEDYDEVKNMPKLHKNLLLKSYKKVS